MRVLMVALCLGFVAAGPCWGQTMLEGENPDAIRREVERAREGATVAPRIYGGDVGAVKPMPPAGSIQVLATDGKLVTLSGEAASIYPVMARVCGSERALRGASALQQCQRVCGQRRFPNLHVEFVDGSIFDCVCIERGVKYTWNGCKR